MKCADSRSAERKSGRCRARTPGRGVRGCVGAALQGRSFPEAEHPALVPAVHVALGDPIVELGEAAMQSRLDVVDGPAGPGRSPASRQGLPPPWRRWSSAAFAGVNEMVDHALQRRRARRWTWRVRTSASKRIFVEAPALVFRPGRSRPAASKTAISGGLERRRP